MTRSRTNVHRELFGILGQIPASGEVLRRWNTLFAEKGSDAVMSRYDASAENLPERLSEMYLFDRRGYIVSPLLSKAIIPLLDVLDRSVKGNVDTVLNDGGCLIGFDTCGDDEKRAELWCNATRNA